MSAFGRMNERCHLPIETGVAPVAIITRTSRYERYEWMNSRLWVVARVASGLRGRRARAARYIDVPFLLSPLRPSARVVDTSSHQYVVSSQTGAGPRQIGVDARDLVSRRGRQSDARERQATSVEEN